MPSAASSQQPLDFSTQQERDEYKKYKELLGEIASAPALVRQVDNHRAFSMLVRSSDVLLQQIDFYRQHKDVENLYIFGQRFVRFFINVIKQHNGSNLTQNKSDLMRLRRTCESIMTELEQVEKLALRQHFLSCVFRHQPPQQQNILQQNSLVASQAVSRPVSAALSSGSGTQQLRPVRINRRMIDEFLNYAYDNLQKNIEFCGILAGHLSDEGFLVTHLLLPKQTGTADSCHALDEDTLFQYQHQNNLLTLGWIHTHPSQTAFLSSVDLKTSFAFQVMLDEAVAVVCAPSQQNTSDQLGIFRITSPEGMESLRQILAQNPNWSEKCHEYVPNADRLFEPCKHVSCGYSDDDCPYAIVDLR